MRWTYFVCRIFGYGVNSLDLNFVIINFSDVAPQIGQTWLDCFFLSILKCSTFYHLVASYIAYS